MEQQQASGLRSGPVVPDIIKGAPQTVTRRAIRFAVLAMAVALAFTLAACTKEEEKKPLTYTAPPAMTIDPQKSYVATIETIKGDLVCELFAADAPATVNNFVFLAREGFYDGVIFHRVVANFVIQGGDPTGTGSGGPGYRFADEFSSRLHGTGALSMANSGANTNGSQFFITFSPQSHLDGKHSVFGQLTSGMDIMLKIREGDAIKTIRITES